jgi:glycosyltransferase involved in cell wall biosynthesis
MSTIDTNSLAKMLEKKRVAFLSSYPPRECGIATYSKDLVDSVNKLKILKPSIILAINDKGGYYNYPRNVRFQIESDDIESYKETAEYVNNSDIDLVHLQHEFGLFGKNWGENIITFQERIKKPIITTLHTLLIEPCEDVKRITEKIVEYSNHVTVIARTGINILENVYEKLPDKIEYIPHGTPNVPFIRSEILRRRLGLKNRIVLSTFGLINRGKGIEYGIRALPKLVKKYPGILYLIIGETHPEVRKYEGENYRKELLELVSELGLEKNVRFENRFLRKSELIRYLQATDIYIIPYTNKDQISSGTLAYAISTGKAIISTPFLHAKEVISEGSAMECKFRDPQSITNCIDTLLNNEDIKHNLEQQAYSYGRDKIWPNIAMEHINLYYKALGL